MKHCATCTLEYPDTSRFCKSCGGALTQTVESDAGTTSCPACGAAVKADWRFCKQCAAILEPMATLPSFRIDHNVPSFAPVAPLQPPGTAWPTDEAAEDSPYPPVRDEVECPACGRFNPSESQVCAGCGALLGAGLKKRAQRRRLIAASAVLFSLALVAGGLAIFWYLWGVTVTVMTDPAGATVFMDGKNIGQSREGDGVISVAHVRTGDHSLRVVHDGYDEWKQAFGVEFTNFDKSLNIKLNPTMYKLTVLSSPTGSEVLVDNVSVGTTGEDDGRLETEPFKPGEHVVTVRRDGYREWKQSVKLNGDMTINPTLNPAPVIEENSSSAEDEIKNALEGWAQSTRNRDIDAHMQYYADTLDYYYHLTLVPSSKVREDRSKAFAKFNYLSVQLSNMSVQLDSTGQRATVICDKAFDFRGDYNAFFSGSVQDQLTVNKLGGAWLITGEKELKVYYVNK